MSGGVPAANYTQVPNLLLDELLPKIDSLTELKVALVIVRATLGWQKRHEVLSLSLLQRLTGLRRESVVDGLRRAHERGYIGKYPVGNGFAYGLVIDGEVVRKPDYFEDVGWSANRTTTGPQTGPSAGPQTGPQLKKGGKKSSGGKKARERACPATVNRQRVSEEERVRAWEILDAFSAIAGRKFGAKGFVEKIIRRMREHPELSVEDHRAVIKSVFAGPHWWSGAPDPRIIYGSDGQFESCMGQRSPRLSVQSGGDDSDWDAGMRTGSDSDA